VEKLSQASVTDLEGVYGIGPEIAEAVVDWFRNSANQTLVEDLQSLGLELADQSVNQTTVGKRKLTGKTFVLTGTLPNLSRSEAQTLIETAGGKVTSSVSAKTDYVVVGEKPGSKADKAQSLNIPLLSEDQLLALLGDTHLT
jgi:DNA ligase (NAD+)